MTLTVGRACSAPRLAAAALFSLMPLLVPAAVMAAPISVWDTPQAVSADSDVVNNLGTLKYAYNFGFAGNSADCGLPSPPSCSATPPVTSTTINGVTFTAFGLPRREQSGTYINAPDTPANARIAEDADTLVGDAVFRTPTPGQAGYSGSPNYGALLNSGATANNSRLIVLVLGNLIPTHEYLFQWWSSDVNGVSGTNHSTIAELLGSDTVTLATQGPGEYAIARFIATSREQTIEFAGSGSSPSSFPVINGFQLREITVPTPTPGLLALGGLALALLWRRQRPA